MPLYVLRNSSRLFVGADTPDQESAARIIYDALDEELMLSPGARALLLSLKRYHKDFPAFLAWIRAEDPNLADGGLAITLAEEGERPEDPRIFLDRHDPRMISLEDLPKGTVVHEIDLEEFNRTGRVIPVLKTV